MAQGLESSIGDGWFEASGLRHILRTLGLAVHPTKLVIGLFALFLTFALGGALDLLWRSNGVGENAIQQFIQSRETDQAYAEPEGSKGIFETWRIHEQGCLLGLLGSSLPGSSVASGTPLGAYVDLHSQSGPLRNISSMIYGLWWLVRFHTVFAVLFVVGSLLIWSWCGGAICRIAAVQIAHDEKLSLGDAFHYVRKKLIDGFLLAPCIPFVFILVVLLLLFVGGMVLRIPVLGDIVCGLGFGLAILGGFVIAVLVLGVLVGGSFLWPAVATEGADAFDSFSRSLSYPLSKPWKWVLYTVIATVYASICWLFVHLFAHLVLVIARGAVGVGTSPFGRWSREVGGEQISKLELLWPMTAAGPLYSWPDTQGFAWWEYISAFFIGAWVLLVIGLTWSFLASFYFSGSTVIYFLLRRDVDGTDFSELYTEEEVEHEMDSPRDTPAPVKESSDIALPVTQTASSDAPATKKEEPDGPTTADESAPDKETPPPSETADHDS